MPEEANPSKRKWFRLKPQFSLQTLLILMLVAALVCAWLLAPRMEEKLLGGGALKIRARWSRLDVPPNATNPAMPDERYLHGRWILYDRYGRKRVEGGYVDGEAAGTWRYFDTDGHEILGGAARYGHLDGQWTARHPGGLPAQQVSFKQRDLGGVSGIPVYPATANMGGMWSGVTPGSFWEAKRNGLSRREWDGGPSRVVGQFADDWRAGQWTWFDQEGNKVAEGSYRRGRKQGEWRRWETPGGSPVVEYFAAGQRIDDLEARLAGLAADLRSAQVQRRARAVLGLERLGSAAVPILREILREGDTAQRLLAIRTLTRIGPDASEAGEELEIAAGDEQPRIQLNALLALAETDPTEAARAMDRILMLAADKNHQQQGLAIDCLTRSGPAGVLRLMAVVYDDKGQSVRFAAFQAIVRMDYERTYCTSVRGDPNVDVGPLAEFVRDAVGHPDREIHELAQSPPQPPNQTGGFF